MRYWLFQDNRVEGPFAAEELGHAPGFCPESMVCPESGQGAGMGVWQHAGLITELHSSLIKAAQLSPGGGLTGAAYVEPTLADLAEFGSLQEQVALLERPVEQLEQGLRHMDGTLSALHGELEAGSRLESLLSEKIAAMDRRLTSSAIQRDVELTTIERQNQVIGELTKKIEDLNLGLRQVASTRQIEELILGVQQAAFSAAAPPAAPATRVEPAPRPSWPPAPPSVIAPKKAPGETDKSGAAKRRAQFSAAALAVLLALLFWWRAGLRKPQPPPPAPQLAGDEARLKREAIDLVRGWPVPQSPKNVAQVLEASTSTGTLVAREWTAEKIKDGVYGVAVVAPALVAPALAGGALVAYDFESRLAARQVAPLNDAARDLLNPKPPAPKPRAHKPRRAPRKRPVMSQTPLVMRQMKPARDVNESLSASAALQHPGTPPPLPASAAVKLPAPVAKTAPRAPRNSRLVIEWKNLASQKQESAAQQAEGRRQRLIVEWLRATNKGAQASPSPVGSGLVPNVVPPPPEAQAPAGQTPGGKPAAPAPKKTEQPSDQQLLDDMLKL